jgi:hypothetical protein
MLSAAPFRDDLAAAIARAERLARDNALLRARLAARRLDCVQWLLVSIIALCSVAIGCIILAAGR